MPPTPSSTVSDTTSSLSLQRISRWLAWACAALVWALPIAVAAGWWLADTATLGAQAHLAAGAIQQPLTYTQRMLGALLTGVPVGLLAAGLWTAQRCFGQFAAGQVFTTQAVRGTRRFAGWVMASVAVGLVVAPALTVLLTWHNPPGMRQLALSVDSDPVFTLLFAGVVWLMAAVIGQGQALAEENASFV